MVAMSAASASARAGGSVVAELEGALLRDACTFPYFMLVAFEASGLPRFVALLALWPAAGPEWRGPSCPSARSNS